jgi:prophage regulatory protein
MHWSVFSRFSELELEVSLRFSPRAGKELDEFLRQLCLFLLMFACIRACSTAENGCTGHPISIHINMTLHSFETRDPLACESFLRISDVLSRVGVSRSTWSHWVKVGSAPKPIRLGPSGHLVAWLESEIRAWMEEQKNRSRAVAPSFPRSVLTFTDSAPK